MTVDHRTINPASLQSHDRARRVFIDPTGVAYFVDLLWTVDRDGKIEPSTIQLRLIYLVRKKSVRF